MLFQFLGPAKTDLRIAVALMALAIWVATSLTALAASKVGGMTRSDVFLVGEVLQPNGHYATILDTRIRTCQWEDLVMDV